MVFDRVRRRLPLLVAVLLLALCMVLVAFACACAMSDQIQASIPPASAYLMLAPGLVQVWPLLVLSLLAAFTLASRTRPERAMSQSALQRFLC
jgi:putative copper export protein